MRRNMKCTVFLKLAHPFFESDLPHMFKINWVVVVDNGIGRIGIDIIVRDHDDSILAIWLNLLLLWKL